MTKVLLALVLILGSISFACGAEPAPTPPPSELSPSVPPAPSELAPPPETVPPQEAPPPSELAPPPEVVPSPSLPSMGPGSEIPANYTTYMDDSKLFSISYPSDWKSASSSIADTNTKAVKKVIDYIQSGLPIDRVSIIFMVGQPMAAGGYDPGVNIMVEPIIGGLSGPATNDEMVETEIYGVKMVVQDYREFSRIKETINGREATIVDWEGTLSGTEERHLQMMTIAGKTMWIVSCSSNYEDWATWEKDFHAIVRSLRISD